MCLKIVSDNSCDIISQEAALKEMERKHLCEMLVMERLISEEKESELRKATQQLSKEQQQERLFELKVCAIISCNDNLRRLQFFRKMNVLYSGKIERCLNFFGYASLFRCDFIISYN